MSKSTKRDRVGNPALALAMQGKRGSSAASPHRDKRTKRARTRATQKVRALSEW